MVVIFLNTVLCKNYFCSQTSRKDILMDFSDFISHSIKLHVSLTRSNSILQKFKLL